MTPSVLSMCLTVATLSFDYFSAVFSALVSKYLAQSDEVLNVWCWNLQK